MIGGAPAIASKSPAYIADLHKNRRKLSSHRRRALMIISSFVFPGHFPSARLDYCIAKTASNRRNDRLAPSEVLCLYSVATSN